MLVIVRIIWDVLFKWHIPFDVQGSVHRKCIPKYYQQDAKLHSFYFCKLLYMLRVDPPTIIRSTTLYLQHRVFVKPLLLPAAIMEELKLFHDSGG